VSQYHWDPAGYLELMRREVPAYPRLQEELVSASAPPGARRVLDLGTGTGETARRVLDAHPGAVLLGIDASADMLAAARTALAGRSADLRVARLEDRLPPGPFDLVVSALAVHHLGASDKRELFARVAGTLAPGGRLVLADVVVPDDPADAVAPLDPGYDLPSPAADQLAWMQDAGLSPRLAWAERDLAVMVGLREP
jgi:tRNA (cmo5U34)-methyltransferase